MDTEKIVSQVAKRAGRMLGDRRIVEVEDDVLQNVVIAGAIHEALDFFVYITRGNQTAQLLSEDKCIDLTFNDIVRQVSSDDVLKQVFELMKGSQQI